MNIHEITQKRQVVLPTINKLNIRPLKKISSSKLSVFQPFGHDSLCKLRLIKYADKY